MLYLVEDCEDRRSRWRTTRKEDGGKIDFNVAEFCLLEELEQENMLIRGDTLLMVGHQ